MHPTPAMQALIEQIYHIFRRYPAPKQFVVCCEYCLSQQEQKALRNTSLRAIPYSLINAWNSSPGPDPQNSDEVRYFLPRLLEFVAQGQFDNIHEVFSLRRINLASKENWREDEREILQQFACQYMTDWVSGDEAVELQYKLEMFFRADIALSPLLAGLFSGLFLVNSLEFHSLYFSREISVAGKYPKFLSDICLASPEFFPFLAAAVD
ncbi:TPA: hypothetical protein ACGPWG_002910 [Escherichia coli]|uniref:hypothetical protein n=1 Tax=Escherichia coli TaxID=562 RepID=UPI002040E155|nr:hypothetical protein [Escherichia coli]MCN2890449.1 hypothetical protein [Escherichia coli]MCO1306566.1 hypothetical protein [Escherichia coli]MCX3135571.1 hypothetical protein [Escherichia coli]